MSGQETELDETSTPVAKVKLELPGDNQKKQALRRIFHEYPRGGRAAAVLLLAVVIIGGGLFVRNSLAWESTDDAQVNGHIMPLSARIKALSENLDKRAFYAAFWKATNSVLVAAKRCAFSSR